MIKPCPHYKEERPLEDRQRAKLEASVDIEKEDLGDTAVSRDSKLWKKMKAYPLHFVSCTVMVPLGFSR